MIYPIFTSSLFYISEMKVTVVKRQVFPNTVGGYMEIQYIPRNMHTVLAMLCFVVVIHWPIFPYPAGLLHWHCGNLTIAPVPAKQPWWIWINTSCEFIMNDCITTTKQSTTKPCAYFLGYTVHWYDILMLFALCISMPTMPHYTCGRIEEHLRRQWQQSTVWYLCSSDIKIFHLNEVMIYDVTFYKCLCSWL